MAFAALAAAGWAQSSAGVNGPVTGFIFDMQAGAIRPMLGIPGAAYLGNATVAGLAAAAVSPDGSAALAVQNGKLFVYNGLRTTALAVSAVGGAIAKPSYFAWADNNIAAIYAPASAQGQILSGLTAAPAAGAPIDLAGLPGPVTALAFDGQRLILAVTSSESGGIYLASVAAGTERIAVAANPSALTVAGSSLYFADSQAQQIFQVQNYARTPSVVPFANDSGIASPSGLQISADGRRLYVANAGSRKLAVYDIASRSPEQTVDLSFTPTRLDRFGDSSVFLMNGIGQGPFYVARDGGAGKAAVYFVPAQPGKPRRPRDPIRPM
ncbi:MAG: hypothetical protein ABSC93_09145 [Bryobacteraceae bacterium]